MSYNPMETLTADALDSDASLAVLPARSSPPSPSSRSSTSSSRRSQAMPSSPTRTTRRDGGRRMTGGFVCGVHVSLVIPLALGCLNIEGLDRDCVFGWEEDSGAVSILHLSTFDALANFVDIGVEGVFDSLKIQLLEVSSKQENGTELADKDCGDLEPRHLFSGASSWEEDDDDDDGVSIYAHTLAYIQVYPISQRLTLVEPDDDELIVVKLIDSLACYSNIFVDNVGRILVPAVRRVKEAHHGVNTRVDNDSGSPMRLERRWSS
ncbi:hypothetical protein IW261DRAFT_1561693 [Armillaria novae-zelandiae]|uniref:Uncharacterized protein n=1 Tax=Armillaria novae-zelandiae TaxID=153914 RepID=A0AA39UC74_9AGAR|nr:hypothetical protein IW261DRAFT_1561693 [Armillaria novae-zelandiae]